MTMTSTLDFNPDQNRLVEFSRYRTLPSYDAPSVPDRRAAADPSDKLEPSRHSLVINGLLALVIGLLIVIVLVGFGSGAAATNSDSESILPNASTATAIDTPLELYVVQPGDSLWSIAQQLAPTGTDLRPVVDYLATLAGGSELDVGLRLMVDHRELG